MAGYLNVPHHRTATGNEGRLVAVHDHREGSGVGNRPRDRREPDQGGDPIALDDEVDRAEEAFPLVVRLRSREEEEVTPIVITHPMEADSWDINGREVIRREQHAWTTCPIVDELVGIECDE
jgi:hypothetical protein